MSIGASEIFSRQYNENGSHDSICVICLATVGTENHEFLLNPIESAHRCDPIRVYQMNMRSVRTTRD